MNTLLEHISQQHFLTIEGVIDALKNCLVAGGYFAKDSAFDGIRDEAQNPMIYKNIVVEGQEGLCCLKVFIRHHNTYTVTAYIL